MFEGDDALLNKTAGSPAFMAPESLQSKTESCVLKICYFKGLTSLKLDVTVYTAGYLLGSKDGNGMHQSFPAMPKQSPGLEFLDPLPPPPPPPKKRKKESGEERAVNAF